MPRPAARRSPMRHRVTSGGGEPPAKIFDGHGTGYPTCLAVSRHAWRKNSVAAASTDPSRGSGVTEDEEDFVGTGDSVEPGDRLQAADRTMTARHKEETQPRTSPDATQRFPGVLVEAHPPAGLDLIRGYRRRGDSRCANSGNGPRHCHSLRRTNRGAGSETARVSTRGRVPRKGPPDALSPAQVPPTTS